MTSATSLFKKEIFKQVIRNVGWISLLYFVGLLFVLPLRLYMRYSRDDLLVYHESYNYLFSGDFAFQFFFLILIPILMGVFVFRYLHVKQSADFFHSLPIRRSQLFHQHFIIGLALLIIPIILTALLLQIVHTSAGLQEYFPAVSIYKWLGVSLLYSLLIYMFSIFIGMLTALSVIQAALTFIFLVFPAGISLLLLSNLDMFLYGFPEAYYGRIGIEKLSPITRIESLSRLSLSATELAMYILFILVCYVASLSIYKIRRIEAVSQAIAFSQLKPIFKYGVTVCTMLLFGVYFGESMDSVGWLFFGYFAGSIIGYFVAEMILEKTWRVFRHVKGYVIYSAFVVVIICFVQFDVFNYSGNMPSFEKIERVYLTNQPYQLYNKEMLEESKILPFEEEDMIRNVYEFHESLIENQANAEDEYYGSHLAIMYELTNGKTFVREYRVTLTEQYAEFLGPIMESEEYKKSTYSLLNVNETSIDRIALQPSGMNFENKEAVIADPVEIKELITAMKQDISQLSYEQMIDKRMPLSMVQLLLSNDMRLHFEWGHGYSNTKAWLAEHDYLETVTPSADDIRYIAVAKNFSPNMRGFEYEEMRSRIENAPNALRLEEKSDVEEVLYNASGYWQGGEYLLAIVYENDFTDILSIHKEHVPDFIETHFQ